MWLLNYAAIHPTSVVRYNQSNIILQVHSDASYLSVNKAHIRVGVYHYLSDDSKKTDNVPIHNMCKIMTNCMASAAEEEIRASFINAYEALPEQTTLIEMVQP